ncbi:hypothetical protein ACFY05_33070 [Microtetraspora fusca]|uniref:Aminotransferase class I/II-fold pyridoxal phosphate-dependent enzyme n=1 Tax=Microtetraspora fusca TaxID=1997 RepID=A0ABW6VED7_MICFU
MRAPEQLIARLALAHGVLVLPGSRTSIDGSFADHLRISYVAEPAELWLAAERLGRAWAALPAPGLGPSQYRSTRRGSI